MLHNFKKDEGGFTLIELLVVILIVGILAAIALPTFLGQQKKGQDASAKSDARNMVSQVESCFTDEQTYTVCTQTGATAKLSAAETGLDPAKVVVSDQTATGYKVTATSKSANVFIITKEGGVSTRTCTAVGKGACPGDGKW